MWPGGGRYFGRTAKSSSAQSGWKLPSYRSRPTWLRPDPRTRPPDASSCMEATQSSSHPPGRAKSCAAKARAGGSGYLRTGYDGSTRTRSSVSDKPRSSDPVDLRDRECGQRTITSRVIVIGTPHPVALAVHHNFCWQHTPLKYVSSTPYFRTPLLETDSSSVLTRVPPLTHVHTPSLAASTFQPVALSRREDKYP